MELQKDRSDCPICLTNAVDCVTECGHAYCVKCLHRIQACAICRKQLQWPKICSEIRNNSFIKRKIEIWLRGSIVPKHIYKQRVPLFQNFQNRLATYALHVKTRYGSQVYREIEQILDTFLTHAKQGLGSPNLHELKDVQEWLEGLYGSVVFHAECRITHYEQREHSQRQSMNSVVVGRRTTNSAGESMSSVVVVHVPQKQKQTVRVHYGSQGVHVNYESQGTSTPASVTITHQQNTVVNNSFAEK